MTVILTDPPATPALPSVKCKCGSSQDKWRPLLGGKEVCMTCGAERKAV